MKKYGVIAKIAGKTVLRLRYSWELANEISQFLEFQDIVYTCEDSMNGKYQVFEIICTNDELRMIMLQSITFKIGTLLDKQKNLESQYWK